MYKETYMYMPQQLSQITNQIKCGEKERQQQTNKLVILTHIYKRKQGQGASVLIRLIRTDNIQREKVKEIYRVRERELERGGCGFGL